MVPRRNYAERLRVAREAAGLTRDDVVRLGSLNPSAYFDLEAHDDELSMGVSVSEVVRVCRALHLDPRALFDGSVSAAALPSFDSLAQTIREYLGVNRVSLQEFENVVGWKVGESVADPTKFSEFNLDGLSAVCEAVGVDWRGLLVSETNHPAE